MAYKRPNGSFGIRNYVLILSMVQCSNSVASQIAQKTEAVAITHDHGCVESEAEHSRTCLGLIRAAENPNVHSVLMVGLGCEQTDHKAIMKEIQKEGKSVEYISIQQEGGVPEAISKGITIVKQMKRKAQAQNREEMPLKGLVVGVQCGGSDWTTALSGNTTIGRMSDLVVKNGGSILMSEVHGFPGSEHIVAENAVNYEVGLSILNLVNELRSEYKQRTGQTIEEVNPTQGNKAGGITTLVEKSMGNVKKMGSTPVQGIIKLGEKVPHPGVWILDNRSEGPDSLNITGFAMSGAHVVVFSSGRGTPVGNAVMPIVKITGNPKSYEAMKSLFDFNAGVVLNGENLDKAGQQLFDIVIKKSCGELTKSEFNNNTEYTIPRG